MAMSAKQHGGHMNRAVADFLIGVELKTKRVVKKFVLHNTLHRVTAIQCVTVRFVAGTFEKKKVYSPVNKTLFFRLTS